MQAWRVSAINSAPELTDTEKPRPTDTEVLIRVAACGLNFADLLMISGEYQDTPPLPYTMGLEFSGEVVAVGTKADPLLLGKRVAVFSGHGGMAEFATVDASRCVIIPDEMPYEQAAGFVVTYGTSHLALDHRAKLAAGETLLVLGASGGVGLTAVEIGKAMGARVIAVARGEEKLAVAQKAGADHVIDSQSDGLIDTLRDLGGVDVVYDPVGGALFKSAMRACKPEARVLTIGFASGDVPQIPANILLVKNITVIGLYWGAYLKFAPDTLFTSLANLFALYQDGGLRPHVGNQLPLSQADAALDLLRRRKATGKVIVTMPWLDQDRLR